MPTPNENEQTLQWLFGEASVNERRTLPFKACASKSSLRDAALEPDDERRAAARERDAGHPLAGHAGLSLVINDDHGMTPIVTIVNKTDEPITLRAVRPSLLATENGIYDLEALFTESHPTIEPGAPLVFRITDIGRDANEPFRVSPVNR